MSWEDIEWCHCEVFLTAFQLNTVLNWNHQQNENNWLYRSLYLWRPFSEKRYVWCFLVQCAQKNKKTKGISSKKGEGAFSLPRAACWHRLHAQTLSNASLLFPCSPGAMGNFLGSTQAYLFVSQGTFSHYGIPLFKFRKVSKNIISLWLWELLGKNALGLDFLGMKASVG